MIHLTDTILLTTPQMVLLLLKPKQAYQIPPKILIYPLLNQVIVHLANNRHKEVINIKDDTTIWRMSMENGTGTILIAPITTLEKNLLGET